MTYLYKVNKHFGSIFTTLLPGTEAKLEPEENKELEEGLCIRVALGMLFESQNTK